MTVEFVTKEDLQLLRVQLIADIRSMIHNSKQSDEGLEGYKTDHVRKILGCSVNKLISLRTARKLRTKKVGGTIYYNRDDIKRLMEDGF